MSKTALYEKTEATEIAKYDGCKKAAETMKTRLPITHLGKAARKRALSEGRLMTAKQAAQAATITKVAGITEADDKRREQRKADLEQADKDIAAEQVRLEKEAEERELAELKRVEEAERAEAEHLRRWPRGRGATQRRPARRNEDRLDRPRRRGEARSFWGH